MKKMKKIVLISLAALILIGGGIFAYFYFKKSPIRELWNYVPRNAVYVIETDNLSEGWKTLSGSKIWQHLITDPLFKNIQESATTLDSIINADSKINRLFTERPLLVSCHLLPNNDFDFLFLIDLEEGGKFSFIQDYIDGLLDMYGYDMTRESVNGKDILILDDKTSDEVFYLSVIDNVFMASYTKSIIEEAIKAGEKPGQWQNDQAFKTVADATNANNLFRFYVNYEYMSPYIGYYLDDKSELLSEMKRIFKYSAFDVSLDNERLTFTGQTLLKDSIESYISMLSGIKGGPLKAYNVIPSNAAMYLSVSFADYMDLYNNLKKEFSFQDSVIGQTYDKSIKKIEKLLGINLEEIFFSWIGNEIAMVKLPPSPNSRENDMITVLHTKNIELAMKGLDLISKKVKRRTPLKYDNYDYKNYTLHYFGVDGFFRMFFGKMFAKLEKPYFVYIEDFVIFSNSPSCLMDVIDEYEKGRVLANDEEFMSFLGQFEEEANVTIFVQGPQIYSHLYYFAQKDQKNNIRESREILASFQRIGFQLISEKQGLFRNKLVAEHSADAMYYAELEEIENSAEDLYISEFDSLLEIELPKDFEDGKTCRIYYEDDTTKIKAEGRIIDGKRDGMWRYYYKSGNSWGSLMFDEGKPNRIGLLYFDEEEGGTKAQAEFEDGEITGSYLEYYSNGKSKTRIEYSEGEANGEAVFYYDSGNIKIEGEYKDGLKKGKWKHYTETGDLMDKGKWKKSELKGNEQK